MTTKTLLLLRHAKSSWDDPQLDDFDRTLNDRGRKAAARIGCLLRDEDFSIDLVLCSSSVRTRETAELAFANVARTPPILFRDDLYHASSDRIASILSNVAEPATCVLVIGHNPGLEEFFAGVTGNQVHFPTAALALIDLPIDLWCQFNDQIRGEQKQFWRGSTSRGPE